MRCKNCHTVMMDTDTHCPSCHASVESATAAAPDSVGEKPNGLWMLLPLFGGALGGLAYAAATHGQGTVSRGASTRTAGAGGPSPVRWVVGLLFIVGGGLLLMLAGAQAFDTLKIVRREPKTVAFAELLQNEFVESPPGWLLYTFAESKPTSQTVTRRRLGNGGEVQARCILVRVEQYWLVATVANGFEGNDLIGRIVPIDSPSAQNLIERVRRQDVDNTVKLLPYEFNAIEGCLSDQQVRYLAASWIGGFGLVGMLIGLVLFRGVRRPAPSSLELPAANWAKQAMSKS
jgi:hypothetical protein